MEASRTHEGQAVAPAQPSNSYVLGSIRNLQNTAIVENPQAVLASWSTEALFDDSNLAEFRRAAGLPTMGDALAIMGSVRRQRFGLFASRRGSRHG